MFILLQRRLMYKMNESQSLKPREHKRPNSDQHQISSCNINAYSTPEVMRIKDMITQGEFS